MKKQQKQNKTRYKDNVRSIIRQKATYKKSRPKHKDIRSYEKMENIFV